MHRRSLIKCILGLTAAPKILGEIRFNSQNITKVKGILLDDLKSCVPRTIEYERTTKYNLDHMYEFVKNYSYGNETKSS